MRVQLLLRAEHLPSNAWYRKRGPNTFAVISKVTDVGSVLGIKRHRLGVTELVPSTSSPEYSSVITVTYEKGQRLAIDVFHTDKIHEFETHDLHDKRYQGNEHRGAPLPKDAKLVTGVLVFVDRILAEPDCCLTETIPGTTEGKLIVHGEVVKEMENDSSFRFHLRGCALPSIRRNFLERPDYFYEIFRRHGDQSKDSWCLVYRSPCEKGMLSPFWGTMDIGLTTLCNNDCSRDLLIRVVDLDGLGCRHVLGSFETTVHGLMGAVSTNGNCDTSKAFTLTKDSGSKRLGQMIVIEASLRTVGRLVDYEIPAVCAEPITSPLQVLQLPYIPRAVQILPVPTQLERSTTSFRDYSRSCSVDLCVAIDFTQGNGDNYQSKDCAHYQKEGCLNDYEWILGVVGETLRDLNASHSYPVWGLGGCYDGKTYPIFQCGSSPKVSGVTGLLKAYSETFQTGITLGNKCKLDNVLLAAAHYAKKQLDEAKGRNALSYTFLTVLTTDSTSMLEAKEKLVSIQEAPMSILFVQIPRAVRQSSSLNREKLEVYMSSRNCRPFTSCIECFSRDAPEELAQMILTVLQDQMPRYFINRGLPP